MQKVKSLMITVAKLGLAAGLIIWLVQSGSLDVMQLKLFIENPELLLWAVAFWALASLFSGSLRWWLLLKGAGYQLSYMSSVKLTLIGFFFNATMPGAVGGDLIKVLYVIRENKHQSKTNAMMTVFLDRVIGLGGLFAVSLPFLFFLQGEFDEVPNIGPIMVFNSLAVLAVAALFCVAFLTYSQEKKDPFLRLLPAGSVLFSGLRKVYVTFRQYHSKTNYLVAGLLLSIFNQLAALLFFWRIAGVALEESVSLAKVGLVFPLGILSTSVPLAPGGLGVGHVAFDRLFELIGLSGGANVFNLYVVSSLCLNLIGFFPYLTLRQGRSFRLPQLEKVS